MKDKPTTNYTPSILGGVAGEPNISEDDPILLDALNEFTQKYTQTPNATMDPQTIAKEAIKRIETTLGELGLKVLRVQEYHNGESWCWAVEVEPK